MLTMTVVHWQHLGKTPPADENYSEMICDSCMVKHSFLNSYLTMEKDGTAAGATCKLASSAGEIDQDPLLANEKATFWPEGWRSRLCRCSKCLVFKEKLAQNDSSRADVNTLSPFCLGLQAMYEEKKLEFLTDDQDTVEYYEQKGKNDCVNKPSSNERLMMALSSLDRVQQVEAITEYQSFSAELKEYLKTFADSKRIVREEDITEFFGRLKERKRRRLDDPTAGGLPHFCR